MRCVLARWETQSITITPHKVVVRMGQSIPVEWMAARIPTQPQLLTILPMIIYVTQMELKWIVHHNTAVVSLVAVLASIPHKLSAVGVVGRAHSLNSVVGLIIALLQVPR